jgi:D-arabinose 5-phosphate isomerase GutQ
MMRKAEALVLARETVGREADAVAAMAPALGDAFWKTCGLIAGCKGIVWVTGVGTSGIAGARFAHILTDCGVRSVFLSPDLGLHGHSGAMAASEALVAISRGGESAEVNAMVAIANSRSLATIAFVDDETSSLARACKHILPIHSPGEYELGGYCATTSTVVCSAVCDAICAVVLRLKGYTFAKFSGTHPAGAVGLAVSKKRSTAGGRE